MMVEGLDRDEAIHVLETWKGPVAHAPARAKKDSTPLALRLWEQGKPIAGTLAAQYLAERRKIELAALPANVDEVLRFHPRCPFGFGNQHPCLIALMRDVETDEPTGIHRIGLTPDANKIGRMMLGRSGAVKLWPAGATLVIGEGIETVLAAATRIPYGGAPLQPAWSAVSAGCARGVPDRSRRRAADRPRRQRPQRRGPGSRGVQAALDGRRSQRRAADCPRSRALTSMISLIEMHRAPHRPQREDSPKRRLAPA